MKNIQEPILVQWDSHSKKMEWRQRCYSIEEVLERWYYRGKWWLDCSLQGESRIYYRVLCHPQGSLPAGGLRQIGPYSDSVRTRKVAPPPQAVDCRVFEIYCGGRAKNEAVRNWVLSRVID